MSKVNNKDTMTTYFTRCSIFSIINFEHVILTMSKETMWSYKTTDDVHFMFT